MERIASKNLTAHHKELMNGAFDFMGYQQANYSWAYCVFTSSDVQLAFCQKKKCGSFNYAKR